jgi:hypothetical protein
MARTQVTPRRIAGGILSRRKRRGHGWSHHKRHNATPLQPRYLSDRRGRPRRQYFTVFWNHRPLWVDATVIMTWARHTRWETNMGLVDQWVDLGRPLASFVDWCEEQGFDID